MPLARDTVLFQLAMHKGVDNGIRACDLVIEICGETSPAHERRLRSFIEGLRKEGEHICGHPSTGYYIAANETELLRCLRFLFDRVENTLAQIAAMRRVSMPDLRGQLRLPL